MKRIFAIMAAVCLCFTLTIPAFAVHYGDFYLPDIESVWSKPENSMYSYAFLVEGDWNDFALWLVNDVGYELSSSSVVVKGAHRVYYYTEDDFDFEWVNNTVFDDSDSVVKIPSSSVFWSDSPIPELGNDNDLGSDLAVLPDSVPSDSLSGVLGEVLSMLVIALPVVAGLFGIRKGIAFLIGRIRGV